MPLQINGAEYFSAAEVADGVGVSRVTLWRWRQDGRIPRGNRLRGRQVLFTKGEVEAIRDYALRVEPISPEGSDQLSLFRSLSSAAPQTVVHSAHNPPLDEESD
jgi:predicted DNA-binding transcriptional regulator AlpA